MKNRAKELDVDFIGGQSNPLTKEEQLAISDFIKKLKDRRTKNAQTQYCKVGETTCLKKGTNR